MNPKHLLICKVIALIFNVNFMCRAIAFRICPWLGKGIIYLYINILSLRWLHLNFRFAVVYRAILMESDDNWSDVGSCKCGAVRVSCIKGGVLPLFPHFQPISIE
jgi:hypothetical protein